MGVLWVDAWHVLSMLWCIEGADGGLVEAIQLASSRPRVVPITVIVRGPAGDQRGAIQVQRRVQLCESD
eukprot:44626-Eustigmatos_ZCMA.PRE.1